jgi:hypothetical protein
MLKALIEVPSNTLTPIHSFGACWVGHREAVSVCKNNPAPFHPPLCSTTFLFQGLSWNTWKRLSRTLTFWRKDSAHWPLSMTIIQPQSAGINRHVPPGLPHEWTMFIYLFTHLFIFFFENVVQAGFELLILLSMPSECWGYGCVQLRPN